MPDLPAMSAAPTVPITTPVIRVADVTKRYRAAELFHDVTFDIEPGRTYGLVGPNGSGKTVLLKLLAGLTLPDRGSIAIDPSHLGRDRSYPDRFGITINGPAYLGHLTGRQNLLQLAAIRRRIAADRIDTTMAAVGLSPDLKQRVRHYSLGMKQKLSLAQALMEHPSVLLLDEPFNALDRTSISTVHGLLQEQQSLGTTIVFTSHDSRHIRDLSDVVLEIDARTVTATDTAR
ncbi:ATP-binding cassette domain-containing protein [uncultured Amnibacterium sp.]|uniref:ATP-binding cassette domain-containing protein n=1 Tax=uncultured Amnibacterium sp. TaxID=1631851 RepID=UPI0035CC040A